MEVLIAPEKIDIYSEYEDTEPLFVKVKGVGKVEVDIRFPKDVLFSVEYDGIYDSKGRFSEEVTLGTGEVWIRNIQLKYVGKKQKKDVIMVRVVNDVVFGEKIECYLKP